MSRASTPGQSSTPEGTSPKSTRSESTSSESTYRYGRFYRSPAFAQFAIAALLVPVVLQVAFSGSSPTDWLSAAGFLLIALLGGYRATGTLLSVFRLTGDRLRRERPFHTDKDVSLSEVRRMFIGGSSVEVYASPEAAGPDLEFERRLEGGDELIEKLARRLPADAKVEHPSGELDGRLGG